MINTINYSGDKVLVELTGTIDKLPDFVSLKPMPLLNFNLISFRRRKKNEEVSEISFDKHRMTLFNDEEFHINFKDGDRVRIKGELQSLNYTRNNPPIDEILQTSVRTYIEIFNDYPCEKKPVGKKRSLIQWDKLLEYSLIPSIPADSKYNEKGEKSSEPNTFVYRVDENGEVFRETEHVKYEVVISSYEKIDSERNIEKGDVNKVTMCGKVALDPYFDVKQNGISFCSLRIFSKSTIIKGRHYFNNAIMWGELAQNTFSDIKKGDYVRIVGRLQSRDYEKEEIIRWKTPSGNKKKKKINKTKTAIEVSVNKLEKCIK